MLSSHVQRSGAACLPCRVAPAVGRCSSRHRRLAPARYYVSEDLSEAVQRMISPAMLSGLVTATSVIASKLSKHAVATGFASEVCRVFNVESREELQDTLAALVLSECVYKKVEMPEDQLAQKITEFLSDFPAELVHIDAVQPSLSDVPQNYLVAVGSKAVYVAFMGTKQARDIATDVAFFHEAIWSESMDPAQVPTAHRGFLARSKSINIEQLYQMALDTNRHLVLCGHSLGGAVAKLCTLRLLRQLPEWPPPQLRCICFATPAVGNAVLAQLVEAAGWHSFFKTYVLPEDQLMQMLRYTIQKAPALTPVTAGAAMGGEAAAAGPAETAVLPADGSTAGAASVSGRRKESGPLTAMTQLLSLPFARESAKQQLRRELQAEECTTTSMDAAAIDAADATAASAGPAAPPAAAVAVGGSMGAIAATQQVPPTASSAPRPPSSTLRDSLSSQEKHALVKSASAPALLAAAAGAAKGAGSGSSGPAAGAGNGQAALGAAPGLPAGPLGSLPSGVNLLLDLQRRWAVYQMQRMGKVAQESLSSASRVVAAFHPFGEHLYITQQGVLPPSAFNPETQPTIDEAQSGMFSHHRMVAYRMRCLNIIRIVGDGLAAEGLRLTPPPGLSLKPVRLAQVVPTLVVSSAAARLPLGPTLGHYQQQPGQLPGALALGRTSWRTSSPRGPVPGGSLGAAASETAHGAGESGLERGGKPGLVAVTSMLGESLDGPGSVAAAAASAAAAAADGGPPAAAGGGASGPVVRGSWRGPLAFLPGGKAKEELVVLQVQVVGYNLHLAKYVSLQVFGEDYIPLDVNRPAPSSLRGGSSSSSRGRGAKVAAASGPDGSSRGSTSSTLGGAFAQLPAVNYVLQGIQQAHVALSRAADRGRPTWKAPPSVVSELTLQVQLPKSVVARLCAQATSSSSSEGSVRAAARGAAFVDGALPAAAAAQEQQGRSGLVLLLKSDFEVAVCEVQVLPYRVGVVGSSREAAVLMQVLLSGSVLLQPTSTVAAEEAIAARAAGREATEAGSRGRVAGAAAKLLSNTGRWWSAGLRWGHQQQQALPVPAGQSSALIRQQGQQPQQRQQERKRTASDAGLLDNNLGPVAAAAPAAAAAVPAGPRAEAPALQPVWMEPWVPGPESVVSAHQADPAAAGGQQVEPVLQQEQAQEGPQQNDQEQHQAQEQLSAPAAAAASPGRRGRMMQQLVSLRSAASAVPAIAAANAFQAVYTATSGVKALQQQQQLPPPAPQAVGGPSRKRVRVGAPATASTPAAVAAAAAGLAAGQEQQAAAVAVLQRAAAEAAVSSRGGLVASGGPGAVLHWGMRPGLGASSGGGPRAHGRGSAGGRPPLGLKRAGSSPMGLRREGLGPRGGAALGPRASPRAAVAGAVGEAGPEAAEQAAADALGVADMECDGSMATANELLAEARGAAGPAHQQQQQEQQVTAVSGLGPPGIRRVASNVQSWVGQQLGAMAVALQQQDQQQRGQRKGLGAPTQPPSAGAPFPAAEDSGQERGPPAAAAGGTSSSTGTIGTSSTSGAGGGISSWPSVVVYQTLPAFGPHPAKAGSDAAGSSGRRILVPRRGPSSGISSSNPVGAGERSPSLQQVLRLTARQLLRDQASHWSLTGLAQWGPSAARGAVGLLWSSVYQRSWQPARDAWSAWRGGLAQVGRGPPNSTAAGAAAGGVLSSAQAGQGPAGALGGVGAAVGPLRGLPGAGAGAGGAPGAGSWDVLLLVVLWDGSFPRVIREPSLDTLVNAAQSAGVPIVPVLLVEGEESVMVQQQQQQPKGGLGVLPWVRHLGVGGISPGTHRQATQGAHPGWQQGEGEVWRVEQAPQQLADACGVSVARVCVVPVPSMAAAGEDPAVLRYLPGYQQQQLQGQVGHVSGVVGALLQEIYGRQMVPPFQARL